MIDGWFSLLIIILMASVGGLSVLLIDKDRAGLLQQPEKIQAKSTPNPRPR
jgi:hypothetical protein